LAAGDNPAPHLQCALAVAHADVALALRRLSHHAEALVQARQTLDLVAALLCRWPGNSVLLSSPRLHGKNLHPGLAFRSEQQDAVLAAFRRGFAGAQRTAAKDATIQPAQQDWARYCSEMGVVNFFLGEMTSASEQAQNARTLWQQLKDREPTNTFYGTQLTRAGLVLATFRILNRQPEPAIAASLRALQFAPDSIEAQALLAMSYLFAGQEEPARAILSRNKELKVGPSETFAAAVLDDVRRLRDAEQPKVDLERLQDLLRE